MTKCICWWFLPISFEIRTVQKNFTKCSLANAEFKRAWESKSSFADISEVSIPTQYSKESALFASVRHHALFWFPRGGVSVQSWYGIFMYVKGKTHTFPPSVNTVGGWKLSLGYNNKNIFWKAEIFRWKSIHAVQSDSTYLVLY